MDDEEQLGALVRRLYCSQALAMVPARTARHLGQVRVYPTCDERGHCCHSSVDVLSCAGGGGSKMCFTWKALPSLWVTIIQTPWQGAALHLQRDGETFVVPQSAGLLRSTCPINTCLLGQVVLDHTYFPSRDMSEQQGVLWRQQARGVSSKGQMAVQETACTEITSPLARVLFFDIMQYGDNNITGMPAEYRYKLLRENEDRLLSGQPGYGRIQWVGECQSALDFCNDPRPNLPHQVDYVFGLSDTHPLVVNKVGPCLAH